MYSLNVPLPSDVTRRAVTLARELPIARSRPRGEHTLVVKRLGVGNQTEFQHLAARVRDALASASGFEIRVTGLDYFADPVTDPAPVVYLTVESPGLRRLHRDLVAAIDPVDDLEGPDYTPHVTVARGGSVDAAERLTAHEFDPIKWNVSELVFWNVARSQRAGTVSLSAPAADGSPSR